MCGFYSNETQSTEIHSIFLQLMQTYILYNCLFDKKKVAVFSLQWKKYAEYTTPEHYGFEAYESLLPLVNPTIHLEVMVLGPFAQNTQGKLLLNFLQLAQ